MNTLKIKPAKLSDRIVEQLEHMLLEGTFAPGQKLPTERELAEQFDVSRPSLREALQKMEAKGLVSRKQGGGTYVCDNLVGDGQPQSGSVWFGCVKWFKYMSSFCCGHTFPIIAD